MRKQWHPLAHLGLFVLTLVTATLAGAEHMNLWGVSNLKITEVIPPDGPAYTSHEVTDWWGYLSSGLYYALPLLLILSAHEFGHYFAAKWHKLKVSLPYYIPLWLPIPMLWIGTMGAVIRLRSQTQTKKQYFDVGIAGPLAGFVVALAVLWFGFTHLPERETIYQIHPEYLKYGLDFEGPAYAEAREQQGGLIAVGTNLVFEFFARYVCPDPENIPNAYEMMHNPFLFAGYIALFFTALNLIPIGQLDGGHILYGLVGRKVHRWLSPAFFLIFTFYAGLGLDFLRPGADPMNYLWMGGYLYFLFIMMRSFSEGTQNALLLALLVFVPQVALGVFYPGLKGYNGWILFAFLIGRFLGVQHPPAAVEDRISTSRKVLGWIALLVFVVCFSPEPFRLD